MPSLSRAALCVFFFNDTATTEIYTLSLHDALPISTAKYARETVGGARVDAWAGDVGLAIAVFDLMALGVRDRKSTRLNSSHGYISYAVFCLKKKNDIGIP